MATSAPADPGSAPVKGPAKGTVKAGPPINYTSFGPMAMPDPSSNPLLARGANPLLGGASPGGSFSAALAALGAHQKALLDAPYLPGQSAAGGPSSPLAKGPGPSQPDFLSWLGDILNRPHNAVTETADSMLDAPSDLAKIQGDFKRGDSGAGVSDILGTLGKDVSAPIRGLFSTNPDDQRSGADLIQKLSDVVHGGHNPADDGDVMRNIAKGVGGFGLDVALDPLTYIPGAQLLEGAKLVGGGIKAGARVLADAARGGKAAEDTAVAAEQLAKEPVAVGAETSKGESAAAPTATPEGAGAGTPPTLPQPAEAPPVVPAGVDAAEAAPVMEHAAEAAANPHAEALAKALVDYPVGTKIKVEGMGRGVIDEWSVEGGKGLGAWLTIGKKRGFVPEARIREVLTPKAPEVKATEALDKAAADAPPDDYEKARAAWKAENGEDLSRKAYDDEVVTSSDGVPFSFEDSRQLNQIGVGGESTAAELNSMLGKNAAEGTPEAATATEALAPHIPSPSEAIRQDPERFSKVSSAVDSLLAPAREAPIASSGKPIQSFAQWLSEGSRDESFGHRMTIQQSAQDSNKVTDLVNYTDARRMMISEGDKEGLAQLEADARKRYQQWVNELPAKELSNQGLRKRFLAMTKSDDTDSHAALEAALGTDLLTRLKRTTNADQFAEALGTMHRILNDSGWLDDFNILLGNKTSTLSLFFSKSLGVEDPAGIAEAYKRAKALEASPATQVPATAKPLDAKLDDIAKDVDLEVKTGSRPDYSQINAKTFLALTEDPEGLLQHDLLALLPDFLEKNFGAEIKDSYKFITEDGVLRTSERFGEGKGLDPLQFNTHKQYDLFYKRAIEFISSRVDSYKEIPGGGAKSLASAEKRAERIEAEWLNFSEGAEAFFKNAGVKLHADLVVDGKDIRHGLTLPQMYKTMQAVGDQVLGEGLGTQLMRMLFFAKGMGLSATKLMDATTLAMEGKGEEVLATLTSKARRNPMPDQLHRPMALADFEEIHNWLADSNSTKRYGYDLSKGKPTKELPFGGSYDKNPKRAGYFKTYNNQALAAALDTVVKASAEPLAQLELLHAGDNVAKIQAKTTEITEGVAQHLQDLADDPDALLDATAHTGKMIKDAAKAANAPVPSAMRATAELGEQIPAAPKATAGAFDDATKAAEKAYAETPKKAATGDIPGAHEANLKLAKDSNKIADDTVKKALKDDPTWDTATPTVQKLRLLDSPASYAGVNIHVGRVSAPLATAFVHNEGMMMRLDGKVVDAQQMFTEAGALGREWTNFTNHALNELAQVHGPDLADRAFELWKTGAAVDESTPLGQAHALIQDFMSRFVGNGDQSILGHAFFNTGQGHDYINRVFNFMVMPGTKDFFDMEQAVKAAKTNGTTVLTELAGQLRAKAPSKDSLQLMKRLAEAAMYMRKNQAFVYSFMDRGLDSGWAARKPTEGMVRLVASKDTVFSGVLPADLYVIPEAAVVMNKISEEMSKNSRISGGFGDFIHNYYMPLQDAWKFGNTQLNPGHHMRNLFGGISMTYFAEGVSYTRAAMRDALKLMSMNKEYTDFDTLQALSSLGKPVTHVDGTALHSTGKLGDVSYRDLLEMSHRAGFMQDAAVMEDLFNEGDESSKRWVSGLKKATLQTGPVRKVANWASEHVEHFERAQHLAQIVRKVQKTGKTVTGKPINNLDELFDYAMKRVRTFHPDIHNLSHFEQKYMRKVIPFYTWTRSAVVAMGETLIMHPARITAINKASYNVAVAAGVNPYSLTDPFPQDQPMPGFLTQQMQGPLYEVSGHYFGVSPGIASWDLFNQFNPDNTVQGVASMLTPIVKTPMEMALGTDLSTGARINDLSDHLDSALPVVNTISNLTGTSVTGSPVSLLTGKGLDPQYQVSKGNKSLTDQLISGFDKVSGLGIKDYSQPNYLNLAAIEKRNAAAPGAGGIKW